MALDRWLARWRREFAAWLWIEHGSRLAAISLAAVACALVLDAAAPLPLEVRWGLWGAGCLGFAGAMYRRILEPWARLEPQEVLRRAEARVPELSAFLVSAWELGRSVPPGTSPDLAAEHRKHAEERLGRARIPRLYPAEPSAAARRAAIAAGAWGLAAGAWLWGHSPGVGRVLAPWLERPLEAQIRVTPGSARVPWGASVEIAAEWLDARRERPALWMRTGPGPLAEVPWESEDRGRFGFRLPQLNAAAEYQLRWRGQRTRRFRLEPVPRPQLVGARLRVYPPGRETGSFQVVLLEGAGEVAALRGSWIVAGGKPNVPLGEASLRVSFLDAPVPMRRVGDGSWEAGFPLREDGRLQFELSSDEGIKDPSPVSYPLRALADEPPRVELVSPAFDVEASPRERLQVSYHAEDDYGLSALLLVYRLPGGQERVVPMPKPGPGKESYGDFSWSLADLPVGARVEFQIRADDNATPRPQSGWSAKGYVNLADFEAVHADVERRWLGLEERLARLADKESEMLRKLRDAAADPSRADALASECDAAEAELGRDWQEAARASQEFADSAAKDPYANPGVAAEAQSLASALKDAASREHPAAAAATKSRDLSQSERRHARLEARARGAAKRLAEARQMQGLQDFWNEADRMDQAGSELSKSLSELALGRKPSPEELARLDDALKKLQQAMSELAKAIESLPKAPEGTPEDKSRKTYQVPLQSALRQADALQRALAAGDYASAAKLAQQLADQLSRVRQAIGDAARDQAMGMGGGGDDKMSEKLEAAGAAWDEVIQEQAKSLGLVQRLEDRKTQELLQEQQKLLDRIREKQAEAVRRARELGPRFPPDAAGWMGEALAEFEAKKVSQAPELLRRAVIRLRAQAAFDPANGPELNAIAGLEEEILEELASGSRPPPPTSDRMAESQAAGETQAQVRRKTEALQQRIEEIGREAGGLPGQITEPLEGAQREQRSAEQALSSAESDKALMHEQAALEQLERGRKALDEAAQSQARMESGLRRPFDSQRGGVRRSGGGRSGADTGFVPLPSAKDYQPPRELRHEVERSSRERRPSSYDPVIKEYLRRMSE